MTLASESFADGTQPDANGLRILSDLTDGLDNEAMLRALRATGQTSDFGELRNFLTLINFISRNVAPGETQITPQFTADMTNATRIVTAACILPDGTIRPNPPSEKSDETASRTLSIDAIKSGLSRIGIRPSGTLREVYSFGTLGLIVVGFFTLGFLAIAAHLAIIAARIVYRGRRTCDIPATIEFMGQEKQGRLIMIGIYGCIFALPEDADTADLRGLTEGTYCRITAAENTIGAKVLRDAKDTCSLWFTSQLPRITLGDILRRSDQPTAYDFGILRNAHRRGMTFGVGTLPFQ